LETAFGKYGNLIDVVIVEVDGKRKGFAFVEFDDKGNVIDKKLISVWLI